MTNARYGALGVLDDEGTALAEFITVGLDADEERADRCPPHRAGCPGHAHHRPAATAGRPIWAPTPRATAFPPNHPPMTSFLGVPIKVRDAVYGNLYLTDKIGWTEFTGDDEALIGALALAAGIAIENARLHKRVQEVAVYEERDRLARDLHDTVIQRLFAIGLSLQSMAAKPVGRHERRTAALDDRRHRRHHPPGPHQHLRARARTGPARGSATTSSRSSRTCRPVVGFEVRVSFDGPVDAAVPDADQRAPAGRHPGGGHQHRPTRPGLHGQRHRRRRGRTVPARGRSTTAGVSAGIRPRWGLGLGQYRSSGREAARRVPCRGPSLGGTMLIWQVPIRQ